MNLLITGAWQDAERHFTEIEALGHAIQFIKDERGELPCPSEWVEGVICNGLFLHHSIQTFPNLRYIQLTSAGYDRVPMEYVREHNITSHNACGVYSIPMAEFAVAGALQVYKKSRTFYGAQQRCRWEKQRDLMELCNKTVCIVGCGSVGTQCAKLFSAFGCRVCGVDIAPRTDAWFEKICPLIELDAQLRTADIVILTVPLTEETKHLLDERRLSFIKNGALLINIARGAVVEQKSLDREVVNKRLFVVLNVFEEEPLPPESPLWQADNAILSPHNSFVGDGNGERLSSIIFFNLEKAK